jgi:hypothetical protein
VNPDWITQSEFDQLTAQEVAAADEAAGLTIPADISTADAAAGRTLWDQLGSAANALKGDAMSFLEGSGTWAPFRVIGGVGLATTAFTLGWQIGSVFDDLVGITHTSSTSGNYSTGLTAVSRNDCAPLYGGVPVAGPGCVSAGGCPDGPGTCTSLGLQYPTDGFAVSLATTGFAYAPFQGATNIPPTAVALATSSGVSTHPGTLTVFVPAAQTALPGPGQGSVTEPTTINTTTPCGSGSCFNRASEAQQKANVVGTLTNPSFNTWNDYVCTQSQMACFGHTHTTTGTITLPTITSNETYADWATRARTAGLLGTITKTVLSDTLADPSVAPNDVVRTSPVAGTAVQPQTAVSVYVNPDSTPAPGTSGGAPGAPTLPGVSIPTAATPCNVFPFGIPCWVTSQLGHLAGTAPVAPHVTLPLPSAICASNPNCKVDADLGNVFGVDMSEIMVIVRPILLFVSCIGIVFWLGGMAMGGSTGGGGSAGDEP